jgi:prepilin-type N-terminal cleavage/methylation domain-containing protein
MQVHNQGRQGFTMIELLFAMSFVSVLLILILTATIQIGRIYNKGISLKQVNQSGLSIGNDLRTTMRAANAPIDTDALGQGRLCLGSYSYVWNTGDILGNKYDGDPNTRIGLVKVNDPARAMCGTGGNYPQVPKDKAKELLVVEGNGENEGGSSGVSLRVRNLSVDRVATVGLGYAYTVSYTLSTDDNNLITADSTSCKGGKDDEFCALNKFTFTTYARQGGSGTQ